jgi:hypothetical protein
MYNTIGKTASFGKFLGSWGAEFAGNVETFVVMVFFFFSLYEERGGGVTKICMEWVFGCVNFGREATAKEGSR